MSEDYQKCGTGIYDVSELDEERNCPGCSDTYNWEEQDYSENRLIYENDGYMKLCSMDELPEREKK